MNTFIRLNGRQNQVGLTVWNEATSCGALLTDNYGNKVRKMGVLLQIGF